MPRSGTRWLSFQLRDRGLDIGHERFRPFGLVSSVHAGMGEATGVLCAGSDTRYYKVVHLTRHPLKVISSCCTLTQECQEFFRANVNGLPPTVPDEQMPYFHPQRVQFWMAAYVGWNLKIQRTWRGAPRFQTEQLCSDEGQWNALCQYIGCIPGELPSMETVDTDRANSKKYLYKAPLDWEELGGIDGGGAAIMLKLAQQLGYETETTLPMPAKDQS
jgi:hypothetical protein